MLANRASCFFTRVLSFLAFAVLGFSTSNAFGGTASIATTTPGPTPFIQFVTATYSGRLQDVSYIIRPKAGSLTRPLVADYSASYLQRTGKLAGNSVTFSVFGLYAGSTNDVVLLFTFEDGSFTIKQTKITTTSYTAGCAAFESPTFTQNRTSTGQLHFDYFLMKSLCNPGVAEIIDTDGNLRWSGPTSTAGSTMSSALYENGVYFGGGSSIFRMELTDTSIKTVGDYAAYKVQDFHHNLDRGRVGLVADVDTATETEAINLEFDPITGKALNQWDLGQIITAAMIAGGDDPSIFGPGTSTRDWFHNNATTYNRADNTLIVSSRESFVIAVDYDTPPDGQKKIHWILGDPTKAWYQYPSLRKYALNLSPGTLPPSGQHAISLDEKGNLLLFDDGEGSFNQFPQGQTRTYSAVREFILDTARKTATAGFVYSANPEIKSNFCGSVYEARGSYLVDFAQANNAYTLILQGLDDHKNVVFELDYPGNGCSVGWNAIPLKTSAFYFQ